VRSAVTTPAGTLACPACGGALEAFAATCRWCGAAVTPGTEAERQARLREKVQAAVGAAYVLLDEVGRGGMGIVFRARETALDREVALKVLAFDPLMAPQAFQRFEREARLAAKLDHPHIVPIFAVGHLADVAYYTMRYVAGGSLEGELGAGRAMAPDRALALLRQVGAALDYAHARGVVHRDIKPANVLLADAGHALVADFGIARAVQPGEGGAGTTSSGVVGSPAYMAPEQWRAEAVDGRADQYALAIVAFEMLTGERPFRGAGVQDLLKMHLLEEPPDLTAKRPDLPAGVAAAIRRGMSKEPADRYGTASAFVDAVAAGLAGRPVGRPAPARTTRGAALPPPQTARAAAASRPRVPWLLVGALAVLAAGVAVMVLARPGAEPTPAPVVAAPAPPVVTVPETVVVERQVAVPAAPTVARATARGVIAVGVRGGAAAVLVDGKEMAATTPAVIELPVGRHVITLRGAEGQTFLPAEYNVEVTARDTAALGFQVAGLPRPTGGFGPRPPRAPGAVILDTALLPPEMRELLRTDPEKARALIDQAARQRLRALQEQQRRRPQQRPPSP
jgi:serine/threonine-protein kinase